MWGNLNGMHLIILLIVILLLFGAAKLPALAKSMGQSARLFRGEMKALKAEGAETEGAETDTETTAGTVNDILSFGTANSTATSSNLLHQTDAVPQSRQ